jgi:hypothetical protein
VSTDTIHPRRTEIVAARRTTEQLLAAARNDSDAVSVFHDGTGPCAGDTAIFVVKGLRNVVYLAAVCERQGLLTAGKPVENPKS